MKCYHCGSMIPENAAFCPVCGQAQDFDTALVYAAAEGDDQAIAELYNKTYSAVYHKVKFLVKDEETAFDIIQESYITAFSHLSQLENPAKFGPWVKRIAHNRAIDHLRRARPVLFSEMGPDDSENVIDFPDERPENIPDMVIDQQETARLLKEILDTLPEDQRACITLFYYDQLSVKEIARTLGVSEATVKSRLNYGRNKVEKQVRDLEKRGTRLYGLAPIPLLLVLLHSETVYAAALPTRGILAAIFASLYHGAGAGAAGAAGAGTAGAAGAGAGVAGAGIAGAGAAGAGSGVFGTAAAGLGIKIVTIASTIAVIGGGAAVWHAVSYRNHNTEQTEIVASSETAVPETTNSEVIPDVSSADASLPSEENTGSSSETTVTAVPTVTVTEITPTVTPTSALPAASTDLPEPTLGAHMGEDIISEYYYVIRVYIDLINALKENQDAFFEKYDSGYYDNTYSGIQYHLIAEYLRFGGEIRFGFADYNGDGITELILSLHDNYQSNGVIEAYTFNGLGAKQLFYGWELGYRSNLELLQDGTFRIRGSSGAASGGEILCEISEDRNGLTITETFSYDYEANGNDNLYGDSGSRYTRAEFESLYPSVTAPESDNGVTYPLSEEGIQQCKTDRS